ncbi:TPA: NADP-dependent oxidoreductase [Photobacterium damselae]
MSTYQQVVISQFGGVDVLQCQLTELPTVLEPHQVLVKVDYCAVNPIDAKIRQGSNFVAQQIQNALPWGLGYDIAGKVVSVGSTISALKTGQRVAGLIGFPLQGGGYSQYCVVDWQALSVLPEQVDLRQAAAVPLAGLTAMQAIELADIQPQERVLVLAGSGGVGHLALQLLKALPCQVLATGSSTNQAFIASLGAEAIDYDKVDFVSLEPVNVIIDLVGGKTGLAALDALKPSGRIITVPTVTQAEIIAQAQDLGFYAQGMVVQPDKIQQDMLLQLIAEKKLRVHIDQQFDFSSVAQAHQHIESGRTRGKLVLATMS